MRGGRDYADFLIVRNLVKQFGEHGGVTYMVTGNLALGDYKVITCRQWIARISSVSAAIPPLSEWTIRLPGNGYVLCATGAAWMVRVRVCATRLHPLP